MSCSIHPKELLANEKKCHNRDNNFEGMWPCKMLMIVTPTDYVRLQYLNSLHILHGYTSHLMT